MKDIAAVVVTYNRKKLLQENIKCLIGQKNENLDIVVIDNNSTDGTEISLKDWIDDGAIIYINTGINLGGAGGFQKGIRYAVERNYKYIWVMDDDCMPRQNTLQQFIEYDERLKGDYGFLTSQVLWKDESICVMNIQKSSKWRRISDFDKMQKVQYASFVSLFLRVEVVKELGLPYKDFFIWGDDWEFTRRISKKYDCYYLPQCIVVHKCATNVGADIISCEKERIERFRYMYRNDVVLYRQDGLEGYFYLFIRTLLHTIRIISQTKDGKWKKIKIMYGSLLSGLSFRPDIEYVEIGDMIR